MKPIVLIAVLAAALLSVAVLMSFRSEAKRQYMMITTVESILPGGVGRSRIIITNADGKSEFKEIENLFTLVGINFKNIEFNNENVIRVLNDLGAQGWELESVATGVQSPGDSGGASNGIFMTRYTLARE